MMLLCPDRVDPYSAAILTLCDWQANHVLYYLVITKLYMRYLVTSTVSCGSKRNAAPARLFRGKLHGLVRREHRRWYRQAAHSYLALPPQAPLAHLSSINNFELIMGHAFPVSTWSWFSQETETVCASLALCSRHFPLCSCATSDSSAEPHNYPPNSETRFRETTSIKTTRKMTEGNVLCSFAYRL